MKELSTPEKIELAAIPATGAVILGLAPRTGFRAGLGELVAAAALLLLLQGFFRDLWLLRAARRRTSAEPPRRARCLCVESALGLTGVVAGIGLTGFGLPGVVAFTAPGLALAVVLTTSAGFLLKDFVFEWSPWKLYREKNHAQVIFRWKS